MRHFTEPGLLDAMKDCLRDLENVKLLSPDDLDIIDEKRILRQKIAELERERTLSDRAEIRCRKHLSLFRLRALQTWPNVCNNPCASQPPSNACQIGVRVMQGKAKEEWMQMCEQAAIEQDSEKLMALVTEINRMLDEKEQRLKSGKPLKSPFQR